MRLAVSIGLALIGIGYLLIQFGALVLDDATIRRDTGEDAAYDAETLVWLRSLRALRMMRKPCPRPARRDGRTFRVPA